MSFTGLPTSWFGAMISTGFSEQNCKLQMDGSDQWGNIVTGTELFAGKPGQSLYFTCPLITTRRRQIW